jgi:hypothetical protein
MTLYLHQITHQIRAKIKWEISKALLSGWEKQRKEKLFAKFGNARKKEILEEDVYQPVIQEAKGLHFAPAN